jgi:hypothetical protein
VLRALALPAMLLALAPFQASTTTLPPQVQDQLKAAGTWQRGCPVPLSGLRLMTVSYQGFDGQSHTGQLIVNRHAVRPLTQVFRRLYAMRFPIRHLELSYSYGRSPDGDGTGSFECRQAVPSPCTGGRRTGTWSNHAFGLAVDLNPRENPYVGCGQSRDPATRPFFNRSLLRPGMVTPQVIAAFRSIGWGWGGAWTGNTKDYMHFSFNGH